MEHLDKLKGALRARWRAVRAVVARRELRFATSEYTVASEVAKELARPGWFRALGDPAWDRRLAASALVVWRLPVVELTMRRSEADAWFSPNFVPAGRKISGSRRAQSVLACVEESQYVAGKGKQALRTNLRHARAAGVVCTKAGYDEFDDAARAILEVRRGEGNGGHQMHRPCPGETVPSYYVASDQEGTPLVFAGVAVFGNFGLLFAMLSNPEHPAAVVARYLLHTFLVADLAASGTAYILAGSVLRESPGNQYFQHLLGYRACNLRFKVVPG